MNDKVFHQVIWKSLDYDGVATITDITLAAGITQYRAKKILQQLLHEGLVKRTAYPLIGYVPTDKAKETELYKKLHSEFDKFLGETFG